MKIKTKLMFSVLLLAVCFSLFIGSTFALNTAAEGNDVNQLATGEVDAELLWSKDRQNWQEISGGEKVFGDEVKWEPGYTMARYFELKNSGDYPFSYVFKISYESSSDLAKVIDVYRCDLPTEQQGVYTDREALLSGAERLGSLDQLTDGVLIQGDRLDCDETAGFTIVLSMQENAGNDYQDKALNGVSLTMTVTQLIDGNVH